MSRQLPTVSHFMQPLFEQVHRQYHLSYPGMMHDEEGVLEYLRGYLHGVRFAIEYRKWARVIEHICFHTEGADIMNPPHGLDDTARWMAENFGDGGLEGDALISRLLTLTEVKDEGTRERVLPAINEHGVVEWLPGEPEPREWWAESWGDE